MKIVQYFSTSGRRLGGLSRATWRSTTFTVSFLVVILFTYFSPYSVVLLVYIKNSEGVFLQSSGVLIISSQTTMTTVSYSVSQHREYRGEEKFSEPATRTRVYVCGEGLDSNYQRLTVMINGPEKCRGSTRLWLVSLTLISTHTDESSTFPNN